MSVSAVEENNSLLDSVESAIADIAAGKAVIVVDDENRENEGDIIFAADLATPELVAFTVRYSSGYICVSLEDEDCQRLDLPPMMSQNQDVRGTAYTVTVDATTGIDTGISAQDRAHTIQILAKGNSSASDLRRPGHVVPLRAKPGGVLERAGHTEAAVDLAKAAGRRPAGVLCEVVSEENPTEMARLPELRKFADAHGLSLISIEQIQEYRRTQQRVTREATTTLPTVHGQFQVHGYQDLLTGTEHVALVHGDIRQGSSIPVRLHSECLTGDVFGSVRCDCGEQLEYSLKEIKSYPSGVLIYIRGHEGRGIGLIPKLKSYILQDQGMDTVDANTAQGYSADAREYGAAAAILQDLGISSIRLMSNNPAKKESLESLGIRVEGRIPVELPSRPENKEYLETKRARMGHQLDSL